MSRKNITSSFYVPLCRIHPGACFDTTLADTLQSRTLFIDGVCFLLFFLLVVSGCRLGRDCVRGPWCHETPLLPPAEWLLGTNRPDLPTLLATVYRVARKNNTTVYIDRWVCVLTPFLTGWPIPTTSTWRVSPLGPFWRPCGLPLPLPLVSSSWAFLPPVCGFCETSVFNPFACSVAATYYHVYGRLCTPCCIKIPEVFSMLTIHES